MTNKYENEIPSNEINLNEIEQQDTRLSKDEALDKANMMRGYLGVRSDGNIPGKFIETALGGYVERVRPTAEDYDRAIEMVEEIERLAEVEPNTQKFLNGLGRILGGAVSTAEFALLAIGGLGGTTEQRGEALKDASERWHRFDDARSRLRELKKSTKFYLNNIKEAEEYKKNIAAKKE